MERNEGFWNANGTQMERKEGIWNANRTQIKNDPPLVQMHDHMSMSFNKFKCFLLVGYNFQVSSAAELCSTYFSIMD